MMMTTRKAMLMTMTLVHGMKVVRASQVPS